MGITLRQLGNEQPKAATPEILEEAREMCKKSLWYLCTEMLGYGDWDKVHDDLETFLERPARKKLVLVPRGHLKSAIITKGLTIQILLQNPNVRILIANQVWDKAREMLAEIQEYLTTKSILPHLFGQFMSGRWNKDEIVIRQRKKALSAPTVGTTGVEAEMTSTHYDVIIGDDLQGLQNVQTKEQRDKVKRFYRSLLDLLEPGGLLIIVGTRWSQDDLYAEIMEREAEDYDVIVRRVIENGKIIFPKKFSLIRDPARKSWTPDPTGQSMDFLNRLKNSKGQDWFSQYMNNPVDEENQIFKRAYFRYWTRKPEDLYVSLAMDLAISQKQWADYTAIVVDGMDSKGDIYKLDYLRGRWTPSEIIKNLFDMHMKWRPHATGMEVNGFQRTLKYAAEAEMRERHYHFPIEEIRTTNQTTKEFRIKALEPYYRDGKVWHAPAMQGKDFEDELLTFPSGKHDDLIDAFAFQLQLLGPGSKVVNEIVPVGSWEYEAEAARRNQQPYKGFFHYAA